ncbi:methyltransferase domain-containing protein [Marivibrio halodurans]|uniref:Methyltransferase domain-containing protein n=1 Tax=Marivibrio halodurans TaxID=2039722 RepID=A0A8J7SJH8_9PROT|nr:class I SAM-dependent methyltransferase [Marivibrio halodurans]MBP5855633.1 methyltransferase domain-containing protein [Marivibrio halodurans]
MCDSPNVELVVALKPIPLSEGYTDDPETARQAARYSVDVYMCADCGHVQHLDVIDSTNLWDSYTYYSGEAKGMPEHFRQMADTILDATKPPEGALVVDIGSNDGSLLVPFKERGYRVLGIDPATEVARRANERGIETFCNLMTRDLAERVRKEYGPAHAICAFNVFAHADDLGEMVDCVRTMLAPDGLFFFEAQYLLDIIDGVLIASIFHEHMSHHSVKPLIDFLDRHGLELIAVERAPIQHGSLIGTVQLKGGRRPVETSVHELVALENERKLDRVETLREFDAKLVRMREATAALVDQWRAEGKTVAAYGAARSGPTLLAQLGLRDKIDFIVDDHPQKVGKYSSGDGIPIRPTAELLERMPDYTVILAWVHSAKIIESNPDYLEKGGHFVVLCPETRVVGKDGDVKI